MHGRTYGLKWGQRIEAYANIAILSIDSKNLSVRTKILLLRDFQLGTSPCIFVTGLARRFVERNPVLVGHLVECTLSDAQETGGFVLLLVT